MNADEREFRCCSDTIGRNGASRRFAPDSCLSVLSRFSLVSPVFLSFAPSDGRADRFL
jgi:hypothetical protein